MGSGRRVDEMGDPLDRMSANEVFREEGFSRRSFFARLGMTAVGIAVAGSGLRAMSTREAARAAIYWAPDCGVPHKRTWMAWPSSSAIWGNLLSGIQTDIATIAKTVAKYEPVIMCADGASAASTAASKCGPTVTVISSIPVDDCWACDTMPIFRVDGAGSRDAVGLNFNGWGNKQTHAKDALVASRVASYAGVPFAAAGFVGEGGAIEYDGEGTVMATESSLVNANRNGTKTKAQIEASARR